MIHYLPAIRVTIQQNVRKKKKELFHCSFLVQSVKNHGTKITCTSQYFVCEHGEVF